ncbi:MAG: glycosyltransferase [Xenococcaceae cyanobacterium MO_188.B32]|nr:glycosyltransferase [Xenococcaceae cyanobacterium MO_188.B32]
MKKVNIITANSVTGLSRDAKILAHILRDAGFPVTIYEEGKPTFSHKLQRISTYLQKLGSYTLKSQPPYDINLFLQGISPGWLSYASVNCLIPNQEWFNDESLPYLSQCDYILCKTKYAQDIFDKLGCKTELISFTSVDRLRKKEPKNFARFFHLAGGNLQKGTNTIVSLWQRHPEWPTLTIIQSPKKAKRIDVPNIEHIVEYVDDEVLAKYQNSYGVHLCPSEAEGFGHYIGEAMSCQAVTITTDAPPMNELISSSRGILVNYHRTEKQKLGINYYVDPQALEQKINEVLTMDEDTKKVLGENAREWYLENDRFFRKRIVELIKDM